MLSNCIFVGRGGGAGAICRYLMGMLPVLQRGAFPLATLTINLLGSFLIGLIAQRANGPSGMDPNLVLLLKVGFCGGFTTFSTFSLESLTLLEEGRWGMFTLYAVLSVVLCIAGAALGKAVG